MSVVQRDALLLFRTLCKMGMKEESDEVTTKTRLLSLELLQGLLEGVSQSFTKNFHFIDSVKAYLSYALLRASVSSSPAVFQLLTFMLNLVMQHATGIFAVLLLRFRESLKVNALSAISMGTACTGSVADRYADRPLPGSTIDWGSFRPVTTRNRPVMVDFNRRQLISGGISRGRKKKREKKRENLEIRCCSHGHNPPQRASRRFTGRRNDVSSRAGFVWRGGFSPRLRGETSSPRAGFSGRRHFFSSRGEKKRLPMCMGWQTLVCLMFSCKLLIFITILNIYQFIYLLQCLVSLLKSLVDWEKLRRESVKHYNIVRSPEEDVLARESVTVNELKNQDDGLNQFEKAKAHKSTLEAVILEVTRILAFNRKPVKGIELLLSNKLVEDKASAVAQFLKCTPSLDKVVFYVNSFCL
ncbi:hypothetical protein BHM03_00006203 [Ensete ventricosum]|uniref:Uncharacterized protein n=1 Tax=Ensete ventricosum TaxID=4639 RepID=A0A445MBP1_ENSVE|nr:hypothetical protein BHM03_00006203 [Ensete ventricosum]